MVDRVKLVRWEGVEQFYCGKILFSAVNSSGKEDFLRGIPYGIKRACIVVIIFEHRQALSSVAQQ